MTAMLTDILARERADRLTAEAAAVGRARQVRHERRTAGRATRSATVPCGEVRHPVGAGRAARAAHLALVPVTAFRCWLAAGQL